MILSFTLFFTINLFSLLQVRMSRILKRQTRLKTQIIQKRQNDETNSKINDSSFYSQSKNKSIILKSRLLTQTNRPFDNSQPKYQQPHYLTIVKKGMNTSNRQKTQSLKEQKQYDIQKLIGRGTFGSVYSGFKLKGNKKVAIKKTFQDKYYKNRELSILKQLNHVNIIHLLDYYTQIQNNKAFIYIVTDLFTHDLHSHLQKQKIAEDILPLYIYQVLKGLQYLNQRQIAHRDLKPHNILIDTTNHRLVICDFGSAKKINQNQKNISYICARNYRAPQLVFGANYYTNSIDMWSLGSIIFEMVNRRPLFKSQSSSALLIDIIKLLGTPSLTQINQMNPNFNINQYKSLPLIKKSSLKNIILTKDAMLIDLLQKLLVYSPNNRLSSSQALQHQYFSRITPSYMKNLQQKYKCIVNIFDQIVPSSHSKRKVVYKIKDKDLYVKNEFETISTNCSVLKSQEQAIRLNSYKFKQGIMKRLF